MKATRGKSSWIVAPVELCVLCRKAITEGEERSSWNGMPAHSECVRIRALQEYPSSPEWAGESSGEDGDRDGSGTRLDDDEDEGWPG